MAKKTTAKPSEVLSDKDQVKSKFKDAVIRKEKKGFIVMSSGGITKKALHSGIAKTESDSWKLAAHNL